jgi:hypothetical protein
LEEWNAIFMERGQGYIFRPRAMGDYSIKAMCGYLKAQDIKNTMKLLGIAYKGRANKDAL